MVVPKMSSKKAVCSNINAEIIFQLLNIEGYKPSKGICFGSNTTKSIFNSYYERSKTIINFRHQVQVWGTLTILYNCYNSFWWIPKNIDLYIHHLSEELFGDVSDTILLVNFSKEIKKSTPKPRTPLPVSILTIKKDIIFDKNNIQNVSDLVDQYVNIRFQKCFRGFINIY